MLDPIPAPLRDRMEVIRLSGYTPEEKSAIAGRFLIPRQIAEHGLGPSQVTWSRSAVDLVCREYTHEAGVRNLERKIAQVCRKVARRAVEGKLDPVSVTRRNLSRYLGPAPFQNDITIRENEVGVANGLAWTEAGGEVLSLEATVTRGSGLVLTGQLGDVMKESAQAALSYARSILSDLDVDDAALTRNEVHVHVPAGAIPKDGPSAGVTMATALVSLATGNPVRSDVAMTGEVTLRGHVLPVGGVREKALAALRAGIHRVILPERSMSEIAEIPREIKRKIEFIPVRTMRELLDFALERPVSWRPRSLPLPSGPGPLPHGAASAAGESAESNES
jgi:ATP-dependent Lon protease